MKTNTLFHLCLIACLSIFSLQSCQLDDDASSNAPEIGVDYIQYDCFDGETSEIFTVVENMPSYGTNESDLYDYLFPIIEVARLNEIINGNINLRFVVLNTGMTCLHRVTGTDVPMESLFGFDTLINEMPDWNAGTQRDVPIHTFQNISIKITNGVFELNI